MKPNTVIIFTVSATHLGIAILPFLDTYLSTLFTNPCPKYDNPPSLYSPCNLSLSTSSYNYLHGCDYFLSLSNYYQSLTLLNQSFSTFIFSYQYPREIPIFHHLLSIAIHDAVFDTLSFMRFVSRFIYSYFNFS